MFKFIVLYKTNILSTCQNGPLGPTSYEFGTIYHLTKKYMMKNGITAYYMICDPKQKEDIYIDTSQNHIIIRRHENNWDSLLVKVIKSLEYFIKEGDEDVTHYVISNISTFINIPKMIENINNIHAIYPFIDCISHMFQKYIYNGMHYNFPSGSGYIFTRNLASKFVKFFDDGKYIINNKFTNDFESSYPTTDDIFFGYMFYVKHDKLSYTTPDGVPCYHIELQALSSEHDIQTKTPTYNFKDYNGIFYRVKNFSQDIDYSRHIQLYVNIYEPLFVKKFDIIKNTSEFGHYKGFIDSATKNAQIDGNKKRHKWEYLDDIVLSPPKSASSFLTLLLHKQRSGKQDTFHNDINHLHMVTPNNVLHTHGIGLLYGHYPEFKLNDITLMDIIHYRNMFSPNKKILIWYIDRNIFDIVTSCVNAFFDVSGEDKMTNSLNHFINDHKHYDLYGTYRSLGIDLKDIKCDLNTGVGFYQTELFDFIAIKYEYMSNWVTYDRVKTLTGIDINSKKINETKDKTFIDFRKYQSIYDTLKEMTLSVRLIDNETQDTSYYVLAHMIDNWGWRHHISKYTNVKCVNTIEDVPLRNSKVIPIVPCDHIKFKNDDRILFCTNESDIEILDDKCLFAIFMMENYPTNIPKTIYVSRKLKTETIYHEDSQYVENFHPKMIFKIPKSYGGIGSKIVNHVNHVDKVENAIISEYIDHKEFYTGHFLIFNGKIKQQIYFKSSTNDSHNYIQRGSISDYTIKTREEIGECLSIFDGIFTKLNYSGFACPNFIIVNNNIIIFEINPRPGGSLIQNEKYCKIFFDYIINNKELAKNRKISIC